jgi:hypothetical protein
LNEGENTIKNILTDLRIVVFTGLLLFTDMEYNLLLRLSGTGEIANDY